jgi:hypothetical protein
MMKLKSWWCSASERILFSHHPELTPGDSESEDVFSV